MDWEKILTASPLSVALLLCVILALIVLTVVKWTLSRKKLNGSSPDVAAAIARFETRMAWAEQEIKDVKAKVDPLVIAVATLNVTVGALKEEIQKNHESSDEKLERLIRAVEDRR